MTKTGFIAIVGRPNVGKSTLLNRILGEKVAIVSNKPQTTRNRILGIYTKDENQIVFFDTPGIFNPRNCLGDFMVKTAKSAMTDADAVILMADVGREISKVEEGVITYAKQSGTPLVLALNKVDEYNREQIAGAIAQYAALHDYAAVVPISAKNGTAVDELLQECSAFLQEGTWMFPDDIVTDQPERQIASEIIREKILRTLDKEVPHGCAVVIEDFKEEDGLISIRAEIYVEKNSHKGILVGKNGAELKLIGTYAREDMEKIFGTKVYLNLWVRVKDNWRDSLRGVTDFGYINEDRKS